MTPDLIAQAEAALDGVTGDEWLKSVSAGSWKAVKNRDGSMNVISGPDEDGDTHKVCLVNGADATNARFIAWCRAGVPALIARIRELEGERDELRAAIFGSPDCAPELRNGNFREMAETLHAAQKHGQATVATLQAQVEAMRGELDAAKTIAKHGPEGTATAMVLHIAETLQAHGKAMLTTGDDFGAQVLQFAAALTTEKKDG